MNESEDRSRNSLPPIGFSPERAEFEQEEPGDETGRNVADVTRRLLRQWEARLDQRSDRWGEWARLPRVLGGCLVLVVVSAFVVSVVGTGLAWVWPRLEDRPNLHLAALGGIVTGLLLVVLRLTRRQ